MVRIEAFSVLDGLMVRAVGVCLTAHLSTGRCRAVVCSRRLEAHLVEDWGVDAVVSQAVRDLLRDNADLAEMVLH